MAGGADTPVADDVGAGAGVDAAGGDSGSAAGLVSEAGAVTTAGGGTSGTAVRPAVAKYSTAPAIGMLTTSNHRNVPASRRSLSTASWSSTWPVVEWPAVTESFGNCATNSWIVASGSRPTSIAYERTKARLKMPPGRREMSLRSSASSALMPILVAFAI